MCTTCGTLAEWRIFWRRGEERSWEGRSSPGVSPTAEKGRHTLTHTRAHIHTLLHWDETAQNLLRLYLEPFPRTPPWSRAGSCVHRGASSPLRGRDTSPGSAYPPAAALGLISELWEGKNKPGLIAQLIHTHSPCRPEHPDRGWITT